MSINLDSIDDLVLALKVIVMGLAAVLFSTLITLIISRKGRSIELKLAPVELNVDEFINELACNFSVTWLQGFNLDVLDIRQTKLLQISDHLI